jgi:hypothetical protein
MGHNWFIKKHLCSIIEIPMLFPFTLLVRVYLTPTDIYGKQSKIGSPKTQEALKIKASLV